MDLVALLINIIVWGIVLYILFWAVGRIGLPEPFNKIATVVLVLLTVVILLNLVFGWAPHFRIR